MRNRLHVGALGALSLVVVLFVGMPVASLAGSPESSVADAAMRSDTDTVRSLLREGADVNAAQGDGLTALHWSALNGDVATMEVLLYAGANVEPTTRLGGYTPLHLASRDGQSATVVMLLDARSDADRVTDTGVTALHLAAQAGASEAIVALLEHGADINAGDAYAQRAPLVYATANNRLAAMETLIEAGADVSLETRLIDFPERNRFDTAEQRTRQRVVQAAKPPSPRGGRATAGRQPAARQQATPASTPPPGGLTPPDPDDPPARAGQAQATPPDPDDPPAGAGAQTNTTPPDPDDPPAGAAAAAGQAPPDPDDPPPAGGAVGTAGATRTAALLDPDDPDSAAPPDPNVPRSLSNTDQMGIQGGFTALHFAARDGRYDAAVLLLDSGADMNHRTGGDESTPMLVAVINGNFDLAMMLLERGADPNFVSEDGAGPLFAALNNEWQLRTWYPQPTASQQQETTYLQLMRALLEAGADPDQRTNSHIWYAAYNAGRMGVDFTGATAFWRAAYATDVAAMKLLIEYGADPNITTLKLLRSRRRGFGRPAPTGSDDEEDPSGLPPVPPGGEHVHALHAATGVGFGTSRVGQQHRHVPDGWLPAVEYLVGVLNVDVNVLDADGYSAIHNAASRGDNAVIEYLVEHGAEVTFVSRRGQTTIDMANGPQQRVQPFPETIALLEGLGAINNNNCISCD